MKEQPDDIFRPPLQWPRWIADQYTDRTLAYYREGVLYLEGGQSIGLVSGLGPSTVVDFVHFVDSIFAHNLLTFTDDLLTCFPAESVMYGDVLCNERGDRIVTIFRGKKNTQRIVVKIAGWGYVPLYTGLFRYGQEKYTLKEVFQQMREFYRYGQVGTPPTAGACGQEWFKRGFKDLYGVEWFAHRHKRPNGTCVSDIRQHQIGARNDLFVSPTEIVLEFLEIDEKNAHAAAAALLPTGPEFRVIHGEVVPFATYFVECEVTVHEHLGHIGPFPVRVVFGNDSRISYPTIPGTYNAWLWKEEAEATEQRGCTVVRKNGWGWKELTNDFAYIVKFIEWLRDNAPNELIARKVKHALVAGFGRFGLPEWKFLLTDEETDIHTAIGEAEALEWCVKRIEDTRPTSMPHWWAYILMRCRLALYLEMMKHDEVLASDTDAFYVRSSKIVYPGNTDIVKTGDWRVKLLHGNPEQKTFPVARHLNALEKIKNPGKKRKDDV